MPHVAFIPLTGLRVREEELRAMGMRLPGLRQRAMAVAELPSLGLLTLAGMLPDEWTCSYRPVARCDDELVERIVNERPTVVAVSALTASIGEAYRLSQRLRNENLSVVLGGLHATTCHAEATRFFDAVVVGEGEPVWLDLLSDAITNSLRPVYRASDADRHERWAVPRCDLLGALAPPRLTLQTQRGCPLACEFCGATRMLGRFREKPIAAIRRELAATHQIMDRPLVELADDNTFAGTRNTDELLDVLEESGIRYFTEADWRTSRSIDTACPIGMLSSADRYRVVDIPLSWNGKQEC